MTLLQGKVGAEENSGLCVQRGAASSSLLGGKSQMEMKTRIFLHGKHVAEQLVLGVLVMPWEGFEHLDSQGLESNPQNGDDKIKTFFKKRLRPQLISLWEIRVPGAWIRICYQNTAGESRKKLRQLFYSFMC